ncbi:hypothetical protein HY493_05795 [Candidatus Woesearchaeota archaeon]|nr:hypothetical protein [Candidatus Woesearchaeota archaeon]
MHPRNVEAALWHTFIPDGTEKVRFYDTLRVSLPNKIVLGYARANGACAWAFPDAREFWEHLMPRLRTFDITILNGDEPKTLREAIEDITRKPYTVGYEERFNGVCLVVRSSAPSRA